MLAALGSTDIVLLLVAIIGLSGAVGSPLLVIRSNEKARIKRDAEAKVEREHERVEQKQERDAARLAEFERQEAAAKQVRIAADTLAAATEAAAQEARTARTTLATATEAAAQEARNAKEALAAADKKVAAEAIRQQEEVAKTAETARVALEAADARREAEVQQTTTQLDDIKTLAIKTHELTNSQYTAMMEETLDANEGRLVTLLEIQTMQERGGGTVTERTLLLIENTEKKITSLKKTLANREVMTHKGNELSDD